MNGGWSRSGSSSGSACKINARGHLEDGTSFRLLLNEVLGKQKVVKLVFD